MATRANGRTVGLNSHRRQLFLRLPMCCALALLLSASLQATPSLYAQSLRLTDGRILEGRWASTSGVAANPDSPNQTAGEVATKPILMVYDELRRVFIPKTLVAETVEGGGRQLVKVSIWQNAVTAGSVFSSVGPSLSITPFDKYGRRIYEMQTRSGRQSTIQGITELTPRYAKVDALRGSVPREAIWSMRVATSSIPNDILAKILKQNTPQGDPNARLQVVQFYVMAERFNDARRELEQVIRDFPDRQDLKFEVRQLRQGAANRLMRELETRQAAGQHKLAEYFLRNFPSEDVAGETLAQVRQMLAQDEQSVQRIERIAATIQQVIGQIADPDQRGLAAPIADEIVRELSHATVDRLVPFVQLLDDTTLSAEEKTALAITGWLLGPEEADRNLSSAISLVKVRAGVRSYLVEKLAPERIDTLTQFRSLEGATVPSIAKLIARMKPVLHDADELAAAEHGSLDLTSPGKTEDGDFRYLVQLPPEYDPYRRYPTIIALNDGYNTPEQALDFWAGSPQLDAEDDVIGPPRGQSMRHGYITIAVDWHKPHQYAYEFSAREHVAVLTCLRDAMRRFNVDSDRVYLSGHGMGGDAVWDIAQSHPDLWAGVIPIGAVAGDTYIRHYWENAAYVPMYFIAGELDGSKMSENAGVLDRYLRKRFNTTVVEYVGRGHEPFHDDVLNALDWMGRQRRREPPEEFECSTLRPWDNYFWWIECQGLPEDRMVYPSQWNANRRGQRDLKIEGKRPSPNRLRLSVPDAEITTVWLNPDIVDFQNAEEPIRIVVGSRKIRAPEGGYRPDVEVLLEDVRTRADRQRPFWAKVQL